MATVPVEMTFTTGQIVTAAQLNSNVRDAVNFILSPPLALLRQTVAQSFATGAFGGIAFDASDIDRDGGHSNTVNNTRYTAKTPGWYDCGGVVAFQQNASGRRGSRWTVNGTDINAGQALSAAVPTLNGGYPAVPRQIFLNVNDYLELRGFQESGAALSTAASGAESSCMSVRWASN